MAAVRDTTIIVFEGHCVGLYQDLSMMTLQRHGVLKSVMDLLREESIKYQWGHAFRLLFTLNIRTLEEAQRLEGMSRCLEERAQKSAPSAQRRGSEKGQLKSDSRRRTACKPSTGESQKEKVALIRSLRSQDSVPEIDSDH
ncbi:hypothetical protein NDU88_006653 [Pleurodeles waltl]|uniref:Uncharacterized protein n=1 Tax=Pleurodeles waltl TaxID=8319 RepID=A0AAV7PM03_PLEWA|nr:hypothetical protein NDU88_006653 [Pleurodeles waltl]